MPKENIVLYPVTIEIGDDSSPYKSSLKKKVNQHSDKEWSKLIKEFKFITREFDYDYGIKITNVKRYKKDFIRFTIEVIDEENIKKNFEENYNLMEVFLDIIHHVLRSGGSPSFYKENNDRGKRIASYVFIETTYLK